MGVVLSETDFDAFDVMCVRNGLSQTKMLSIAIHEFIVSSKGKQVVMPVEMLKAFAEDSRTRKISVAKAAEKARK